MRFERNYIRPDGAVASVDYCLPRARAVHGASPCWRDFWRSATMPFIRSLAPRAGAINKTERAQGPDMTQDTVIFPQCGKCDGVRYPRLGRVSARIFNKNIFRSVCIASSEFYEFPAWDGADFRMYYKNFITTLTKKEFV